MKYYLTGPMSGIPQFNFPLFKRASAQLRAAGYDVVSPHEMDPPDQQAAAWASPDGKLDTVGKLAGYTWGETLARDVKIVADQVQGLILLPGWDKSRGARLEAFVGLLTGKTFRLYSATGYDVTCPVARSYVEERIL